MMTSRCSVVADLLVVAQLAAGLGAGQRVAAMLRLRPRRRRAMRAMRAVRCRAGDVAGQRVAALRAVGRVGDLHPEAARRLLRKAERRRPGVAGQPGVGPVADRPGEGRPGAASEARAAGLGIVAAQPYRRDPRRRARSKTSTGRRFRLPKVCV